MYLAEPIAIFLVNIDAKISFILMILTTIYLIIFFRKCLKNPQLVGFFALFINLDVSLKILIIAGWQNDIDFISDEYTALPFFEDGLARVFQELSKECALSGIRRSTLTGLQDFSLLFSLFTMLCCYKILKFQNESFAKHTATIWAIFYTITMIIVYGCSFALLGRE
ncbi:MAG: hypothetical protein LBS45_01590 [Synergistaceae bacterium]|nr:hypothetical protein [Synergistaceae bacterium]